MGMNSVWVDLWMMDGWMKRKSGDFPILRHYKCKEKWRYEVENIQPHRLTSKTLTKDTQMLNSIVCTSILFSFLSSFNMITHLTSLNIEHQCNDKSANSKLQKNQHVFFSAWKFSCNSSFSKCIYIFFHNAPLYFLGLS